MSTDTLERPDVDTEETTDTDAAKYLHYVKKSRITASAITGNHVVALCGWIFTVTRSAAPGSSVCPRCKEIFDQMKPDE